MPNKMLKPIPYTGKNSSMAYETDFDMASDMVISMFADFMNRQNAKNEGKLDRILGLDR